MLHLYRDGNGVSLGRGTPIPFSSQLYNLSPFPSQTESRHVDEYPSPFIEKMINPSLYVSTQICIFVWVGRMIFPKPTTLHQSTKSPMNKLTIFMPIHFSKKRKKHHKNFKRSQWLSERKYWKKKMNGSETDRFTLGVTWDAS